MEWKRRINGIETFEMLERIGYMNWTGVMESGNERGSLEKRLSIVSEVKELLLGRIGLRYVIPQMGNHLIRHSYWELISSYVVYSSESINKKWERGSDEIEGEGEREGEKGMRTECGIEGTGNTDHSVCCRCVLVWARLDRENETRQRVRERLQLWEGQSGRNSRDERRFLRLFLFLYVFRFFPVDVEGLRIYTILHILYQMLVFMNFRASYQAMIIRKSHNKNRRLPLIFYFFSLISYLMSRFCNVTCNTRDLSPWSRDVHFA